MDETLEQAQARHRKETKDLQGRITNKKKNATKKNRKGVNDECAELERQMKERHEEELRKFLDGDAHDGTNEEQHAEPNGSADANPDATTDTDVDTLADQLKSTSVDTDRTQPQSQLQGGAAATSGKKRNRQKERLARRAAEQETAAAAAETEASTMVDHRGIERAYMTREFKAHSLREKDIEPDGHCLFSAVADQLEANGIPVVVGGGGEEEGGRGGYKVVRRRAAEYMEGHRGDFEGFLEEPLETYVAKIRDTAEWGGQLELSALANAYGVEIKVVQDGRTEVVRPMEEGGEGEELKTLWLAYYRHGYGLGEHYNSLRKAS
ncbi:OTU-like cysteine protease [Cercophora newfieldiana]|uniref:OTU-like cysteine protease n=1 Tax=Cercophora newfieldiana TaxID=92897 RepID=A0AA39XSD2_9PEZI|nr:OTU-like cysteine protease [Cercophora newfieldiana]